MEPQPHTTPPLTAPPIIRIRAPCNKDRSRTTYHCHSKGYRSDGNKYNAIRQHVIKRQCFPKWRPLQTFYDTPEPTQWAPPQYPQGRAATAHGSAPPAASAQLASLTPPAASLPPFRSWGLRAASQAPPASAAAVGGFGPSTQRKYDDLVHTSGNSENPEDAQLALKEQKAKMYEKTRYHHYEKTPYQTQYKNDLRGGLLSSLARSNTHPANDISFPRHQLGITCNPSEHRDISREPRAYPPHPLLIPSHSRKSPS